MLFLLHDNSKPRSKAVLSKVPHNTGQLLTLVSAAGHIKCSLASNKYRTSISNKDNTKINSGYING
jgi:hypothetical protein